MVFKALSVALLALLLVQHADSATYYVRLAKEDAQGTLAPSGYLTASGKLTANGVTVGHSQGPLSQWDISSVSGSKTLFTASSVGRTKAGGAADLASVSCNSGSVATGMFASEDAAWTFESVNLTGQISGKFGPFFRIALTQQPCGRKMTPSKRFLGVAKSCAYLKNSSSAVACKPKMFSVKDTSADLVWEMTRVNAAPGPSTSTPSTTGLDFQGQKQFLFVQEADSVHIRPSVGSEGRDFQLVFSKPNRRTTWFTDKPFHETGSVSMTAFVKDFSMALGKPNAVLSGQCRSCGKKGTQVSMILLVSSPHYNATTNRLTFAATKIPGWDSRSKDELGHLGDSGHLIDWAQLVIDSTETIGFGGEVVSAVLDGFGLEDLKFGSEILFGALGVVDSIFGGGAKREKQLEETLNEILAGVQEIEAQISVAIQQLNVISAEVTEILNTVQSAQSINNAYTANQTIWNALQASGPFNNPPAPVGTNVHCWNPASTGWQSQLMGTRSTQNIKTALLDLYDALSSANGLIPYLYNMAGQDCSAMTCPPPYWGGSLPPSSPMGMLVSALNAYISTQIQGIGLCQKVVNFTNNPANGCTNTLPTDYCTSMNTAQDYGDTMDATTLMNNIISAIDSGLKLSNLGGGWPAFLWRNTDTSTVSTTVSYGLPSVTELDGLSEDLLSKTDTRPMNSNSSIMPNANLAATPLELLSGIEFNMVSNNLVLNVATVPFSVNNSGGMEWGSSAWAGGGGNGRNVTIQFLDLEPVLLPAGYYALSASLISWNCPNFPTYLWYAISPGCSIKKQTAATLNPNSVLGLEILAASVSIGADGSLSFGETSTWSNEGSCSGSILDDTTTGTYDPNASPSSANAYYPPVNPYGQVTAPGYSFLNLYNIMWSFAMPDTDQSGQCSSGGQFNVSLGAPPLPLNNPQNGGPGYYWQMQWETNIGFPPPGFISGAALTLKTNIVSVGLIHLPNPFVNSTYNINTLTADPLPSAP